MENKEVSKQMCMMREEFLGGAENDLFEKLLLEGLTLLVKETMTKERITGEGDEGAPGNSTVIQAMIDKMIPQVHELMSKAVTAELRSRWLVKGERLCGFPLEL